MTTRKFAVTSPRHWQGERTVYAPTAGLAIFAAFALQADSTRAWCDAIAYGGISDLLMAIDLKEAQPE